MNDVKPGPHPIRIGSTDSQSYEEMRALVQRRVSRFGLLLALIFGMFLAWRVARALSADDSPTRAYLPPLALSVVPFLGLWLFFRKGTRSLMIVRFAEVAALLVAGAAVILMSFKMSYAARPDTILLLCLSYMLIARAVMVPSTAGFTLALGAVFGVPFVIAVFFLHRLQHNPLIYTALADPRLRLDAATIAGRFAVIGGLWWVAALAVTTATSRVIYGLEREVRDARRLGQYTLIEKLGEGGMGIVYRAKHALLRRPTAIKLLPADRFGPEALARFEREVQLTAGLTHPNTIRVFDYGRTADAIFYYAMEYLEGANLADIVAEGGPMPAGRVIHLLDQVAGALSEAHQIGLIHRDIKPANIFLTEQGGVPDVAKVLDFGLVKQVGRPDDGELADITRAGRLTGTPLYMAPEAMTAPESVDARTDLYALGAVGYFLVTGQDVFTGTTMIEICGKHLHETPMQPSQRLGQTVPPDLERLILGCLDKDPARRPPDARTLQRGLRACADSGAWTEEDARRWLHAHAAALRAGQRRGAPGATATVAPDFALRSADRAAF